MFSPSQMPEFQELQGTVGAAEVHDEEPLGFVVVMCLCLVALGVLLGLLGD